MGKATTMVFLIGLTGVGAFMAGRVTATPLPVSPSAPQPIAVESAPSLPPPVDVAQAPRASAPLVPAPGEMRNSVAPLVDRVKASVVAIQSTKFIRRVVREDPFTQFFRERLGMGEAPLRRETQQSLGSGFIIDGQGTVLTNNHVVAGADEVVVRLDDDRVLQAKVVGSDPQTDVAVVKILSPPRDLRPVNQGDSDRVRVGDYVLAIGNPLGLGQTVTMGIVSAKNRSLGEKLGEVEPKFQDFIQTDAAINQGNSGGPLFNFNGEVIGINSAILNPALAMNVGFAIPINLARRISHQILQSGKVGRGFLGIRTEDFTPDRARSLGVPFSPGLLVAEVEAGSPAEKAGLRPNDVVAEIDGRPLERSRFLSQLVGTLGPGYRAKLVFQRAGKRLETQVVLGDREGVEGTKLGVLGIMVRPLQTREAAAVGLRAGQGLLVVSVDPRAPTSGELEPEDVILGVDRHPATFEVLRAFEQVLVQGGWGRLIVQRGNHQIVVTLSG